MDSGLLTMMEGHTGHFGVRRQLYSSPYRNPWDPRSSRGWRGLLARRRFGCGDSPVPNQALRWGESAVAAARVEAGVQVPIPQRW